MGLVVSGAGGNIPTRPRVFESGPGPWRGRAVRPNMTEVFVSRAFRPRWVVILPILAGCQSVPSEPGPTPLLDALPRPLTAAESRLSDAGNQFAFKFFREVTRALPADSNAFVSPLSASFALGMTLNGARGETFDAMRSALEYPGMAQPDINAGYRGLIDLLVGLDGTSELRVANAVFPRLGLAVKQPFLDAVRSSFDAEVSTLDFGSPSAVTTINDWVARKTSGRIPKLLDRLDPAEVMFLVNAIYFKGRWRHTFDRRETRPAPFTSADGQVRSVETMSKTEAPVMVGSLPNASVGELLYGNGAFAMTILLPNEGVTPAAVVAALDATSWRGLVTGLAERKIDLKLPKFRIEYSRAMKNDLTSLGMGIAFDGGRADFSGIADVSPERLFITRVIQKAFVEVNEEGTEAAAATAVVVKERSAPRMPTFRADRPFVFVIRDNATGTALFTGRYTG